MTGATAFRLTQGFYWLSLGAWFGAMVMLAVAAAITFKTVRHHQPSIGIEPYSHPQLADRAVGILAGGIVGNVLKGLAVVQIVCATVAVVCVVLQCTSFVDRLAVSPGHWLNVLRIALILLPIAVLAHDKFVITPRIWEHRQVMYDPAQPLAAQQAAKVVFDRYHKLSERLVGAAALSLAAAVLLSPFVLHPDARQVESAGEPQVRVTA